MPDVVKLQQNKEQILSIIKEKGPSYPAKVSQSVGVPPLIVSAFLAELVREQKLKLSHMKVGSSPLYYLEGQEPELENFVDFLNTKEKEAFTNLKQTSVLEDSKLEPVVRVALRKLKDFAVPIHVRADGETRLFWKFYLLTEDETRQKIRSALGEKPEKIATDKKELHEDEVESKTESQQQSLEKEIEPKTETKPKAKARGHESEFALQVKDYLSSKDIEVLEEVASKKKEFQSKIRIDTLFGKQSLFLTAKDKKKVNSNDLVLAHQKAQSEKMPSLFIYTGELDNKAKEHLDEWRNLIKVEKLSF